MPGPVFGQEVPGRGPRRRIGLHPPAGEAGRRALPEALPPAALVPGKEQMGGAQRPALQDGSGEAPLREADRPEPRQGRTAAERVIGEAPDLSRGGTGGGSIPLSCGTGRLLAVSTALRGTDGSSAAKPRWWTLALGALFVTPQSAWTRIWRLLESADVVDGAISLVGKLKGYWGEILMVVGWGLILYELGRSRGWWARVRRRTSTPEPVAESPQPPPPAPPEPLAVPDTAERLVDLFKHWDHAFDLAAYMLEREICSHGSSEEAQLLCFAIRAYPLEMSKGKLIELRREFEYFRPREATQSAFATLRDEMLQTLSQCNFLLVFWINKGGAVIRGEQLLSVPVYIGFCDAYREALEAARLLRYHSELGGLVLPTANSVTYP